MTTFTLAELKKYNGTDNEKIYVALNGSVFDVTEKGKDFYAPGGPYSLFAGHDASRAMATLSMSVKDDRDDLSDLNDEQKEALERWHKQFSEKYEVVGTLKN